MDPVGTIESTPVKSGAPPGLEIPSNEPIKVKLPSDVKIGADGDNSHLAIENECLAMENARLAWENVCLQQQHCWWQPGSDWYPSAEQQWAIPQVGLQPGMAVVFGGLQRSVELNGQQAIVERWDEQTNRWVVRLPCGEDKFARSENLIPSCGWSAHYPGDLDSLAKKTGGVTTRKCSSMSFGSDTTATGAARSRLSSFEGDDMDSAQAADVPDEAKTTVMMRNIPNDYTREMLMKLIDDEGFAGCYRLIYLPIDYASRVSFGYAFVDLATPEDAVRFRSHFEGFTAWDVVSQKVCEVCWSSVLQGVSAHIERYRNSPVMHESVPDEFRPILLVNGTRVPFPSATKSIRAPRARRSTKF